MDQRRFERTEVDVEVSCHVEGDVRQLTLFDLSANGCMLESPQGLLPKGRKLAIGLPGRIIARGRVVWQRGNCIGVQFLETLDSQVVEWLISKIRHACELRYAPRDGFGRPLDGLPIFSDVLSSLHPRKVPAFEAPRRLR